MNDAVFTAELFSNDLLPGDLKSQLEFVHRTSADKAVLFLDSVIEPSVTSDGGSSFDKLLHVMEDSEYQHVKELAKQIKINALKNKPTKAFGGAPVESKVASTTPTFPNTTAEDESVNIPTVPVTLDAKIKPPIAGDNRSAGGGEIEKVVESLKSSLSLTEPLLPVASPAEVKDSEVTKVTSGAMEENVASLPFVTSKQTNPTIFGEVYFVLG